MSNTADNNCACRRRSASTTRGEGAVSHCPTTFHLGGWSRSTLSGGLSRVIGKDAISGSVGFKRAILEGWECE
jgi:hypothetical protein